MTYLDHTNYEAYYALNLNNADRQEADRYLSDMSSFIESEVGMIFNLIEDKTIGYNISYCGQTYLPIGFWQLQNLNVDHIGYTLNMTKDNLAVKSLDFKCEELKKCNVTTINGTYGYNNGLPEVLKNAIYKALKLHLTVYSGVTINSIGDLVEEKSLTMTRKKVYTSEAQNFKLKVITGEIPSNIVTLLKRYKQPTKLIVTTDCKVINNCNKC